MKWIPAAVIVGIGLLGQAHQRLQPFWMLLAASLWLANEIRKRTDAFIAAGFACVAVSALWQFAWIKSPHNVGVVGWSALGLASGSAFAFLLACSLPALYLSRKNVRRLLDGFLWLGLIDCLIILAATPFESDPDYRYGVMRAATTDAMLIAMLVPYALHRLDRLVFNPWPVLILPVAAIAATQSSVGIGGLIVGVGAYCAARYKRFLTVGALGVASAAGAYLWLGDKLIHSTGRLQAWAFFMGFWRDKIDQVIGSGVGTFIIFGPHAQMKAGYRWTDRENVIFPWMHNEWLQSLFEMGWIGLVVFALLFLRLLYVSRRKPWLFASFATTGVVSFAQMPFRVGLPALLVTLLIAELYGRGASNDKRSN